MNGGTSALYLITGFLGSGKTTLLRRLLRHTGDRNVGLIMNEFGPGGVDSAVLGQTRNAALEINEGSVFCTCKSDAFIDAILSLSGKGLDLILVETSGMADPVSMPKLMETIKLKTPCVRYQGCITVASAVNIRKLLKTTLFVQGQVRQADSVILNKADLASPEELETCKTAIRQYNGSCPIVEAAFCDIPDLEKLLEIHPGNHSPDETGLFQTKSSSSVNRFSIGFPDGVDSGMLRELLDSVKEDIFRVKGFVRLSDESVFLVDGVTGKIDIIPFQGQEARPVVTFIYANTKPVRHLVTKRYERIFHEPPVIVS